MRILIIDNHTRFLKELQDSFPGSVDVISKEKIEHKKILDGYDLLVFSGGYGVSSVSNHPDKYLNEIQIIQDTKVPILGICLGAEIITYALGGKLKKLEQIHQGSVTLNITDVSLSETLRTNIINVYECHHWGIETIPDGMISCAHSDHGPEIIKHSQRQIVGIQFHPEVSQNDKIFEWVFESLGIKNRPI